MLNLDKVINEEQLLDFALSHIAERESYEVHPVADQIVLTYVINKLVAEGKESFTEEDVQEQYSVLVLDKVLEGLVNKGLVDVAFDEKEPTFQLTPKGKDKINGR
jgi:hypothetical protein